MDLTRLKEIIQQEKQHVEKVNLRALISIKSIGRIIGHQGSFQKYIVHKYSTLFVMTRSAWAGKRLLHTCAEPEEMKGLWRECLYMLMGHATTQLRNPGIDFILPHGFILELQENNDDEFKSMAEQSKCRFLIKRAYLPNSTEHVVRISIPAIDDEYLDCFAHAIYLLSNNLNIYARSALATPGNRFFEILKDVPYYSKEVEEYMGKSHDEIIYEYV